MQLDDELIAMVDEERESSLGAALRRLLVTRVSREAKTRFKYWMQKLMLVRSRPLMGLKVMSDL